MTEVKSGRIAKDSMNAISSAQAVCKSALTLVPTLMIPWYDYSLTIHCKQPIVGLEATESKGIGSLSILIKIEAPQNLEKGVVVRLLTI